jgi:hypothetical protein
MPYARSLPLLTINKVSRVPANPKIKLTTFQDVVPFSCARMPAKLRFANTQIAETPPCVPSGVEEDVSIDFAMAMDIVKPVSQR